MKTYESIFQKNVLTLSEVAEYTGFKKSFIYKLTMTGKLPHSKPNGKTLFFSRLQVESWLLSNPIKTKDQIKVTSADYVIANPKY